LLNDGRTGHRRQVQALAHFLPLTYTVLPISLKPPWRWFAPYRLPGGLAAHAELIPTSAVVPTIIISCGRRSALAARWLQTHFVGAPKTVQILDCGLSPDCFNWVIAPQHDRLEGDNVIQTIGSLNPVDDSWLQRAAGENDSNRHPTRPSALLLLGGPSRNFYFSRNWFRAVLSALRSRLNGHDLTVVESPRTPPWVADDVDAVLADLPVYRVGWLKDNPEASAQAYGAALAAAECVFVTADSVNLVSESCASGKPVCLLGVEQARGKMDRFCRHLIQKGYALEDQPELPAAGAMPFTQCLRETESVATRLLESGLLG
jgi:mitochondrial fission protein ELM1